MKPNIKAHNLVNNLIDYMLINDQKIFFDKNKKVLEKTSEKSQMKDLFFKPNQTDTMFWCFYYILNKNDELNNKHFKIEKDFKINFIDILRKNKELIKSKKLKINEIENELLNENKITEKSLYAFCLYYEYNIILVINKIYYTLIGNNDKETIDSYIFFDLNQYKVLLENDDSLIKNKFKAESLNKPIKSISAYKIDEIRNMANTLAISTQKKNKNTLYNEILSKLEL